MKKDAASPEDTQNTAPSPDKEAAKKEQDAQALEKAHQDLEEANDKYLRLYSEFENFRRRSAKEKLLLIETAGEEILAKLLPIVDDFERAIQALKVSNTAAQTTQEGVQLIYDKLLHLLQQAGVRSMPVEKGAAFDTELHEAVTQLPTEDAQMAGKVIEVLEKGYLLKEKVLRFAKVVTGA